MRSFLEKQAQNFFLWAPFIMAFGAGLYFTLSSEPNIFISFPVFTIIALILLFCKKTYLLRILLLFAFGFLYAAVFTRVINTAQISRTMRGTEIHGRVNNVDYTNDKARVFIKVKANQINPENQSEKLATIRVSLNKDMAVPNIGENINAKATLFKPDGPAAPGAFDYAAWAYFNGISATGYINEYAQENNSDIKPAYINKLRNYMHNMSESFLVDTLVLGYKNAVPKADNQKWKATGIGHVWSISGFHMTLVGGWLFALFYFIFRSIPAITRQIPARYPAIIFAWAGLGFYLFLSGLDVATIRAFFMTSLMFIAFLFGRSAFSLRNVCVAFMVIFLINPHFIMQPGFQLSFAAIFGLVWFFNRDKVYKKKTFFKKIKRIVVIAAQTSLIATIFTAPFIAYHFYSIPLYSLFGNMILLPVFSIAIMPLVMIGSITTMFGFKAPLIWADKFYNWTMVIAEKIAELPFAEIQTSEITSFVLGIIIIAFLCLILIKKKEDLKPEDNIIKRYPNVALFLMFFTIAGTIIALKERPVFYSTWDNELVGFVSNQGLRFNRKSASNHYFTFDTWKLLNYEPVGGENQRHKCARGVCMFQSQKWALAYTQRYMPLSRHLDQWCKDDNIDFIVSYLKIDSEKCNHKILRKGFVIYKSGRVKYTPLNRIWHNRR